MGLPPLERAYWVSSRRFVLERAVGVLLLGLLVLVLPIAIDQTPRLFLTGLIWFGVLPAGVVIERCVDRTNVDLAHSACDVGIAVLGSFLAPSIWAACAVVVTGVIVASIPVQTTGRIVLVSAFGACGLAASGAANDIAHWYTPVLAMLIMLPAFASFHRAARDRSDETLSRYDALVDAAAVFFWEIDMETGQYVSVAGNLGKLLGYTPAEFLSMRWHDVVVEEDVAKVLGLPTLGMGAESAVVAKVRHRDGSQIVFRHTIKRIEGTKLIRGVSSNINDLAEATETIRFQAEHDALTGLYNRTVLVERLDEALSRADETPVAVLMLDLNRFKEVNDTLGHPVGDRLLQILAERFANALPEAEIVARLGGDEFAVLLTGDVSRASALQAARRIARATEQRMEIDRVKLSVSPSIGIVFAPEHGDTTEQILRRADIAMYDAKRKGETVRVYETTPDDLTLERLTLSATIGSAVDDHQFELWYQPKICMHTNRVLGAEALARWRHPERGMLLPSEFLELIMLAGEYHRFTDLVMQSGITVAALCAERQHPIEIAVNLASLSFLDQQLPDRLADQLEHFGVPPDRFTLEITEADILDEAGSHFGVFDRLSELGVGLSIDDFGTGYSSLVRLRELPVTEVKLDRSFVSQLETDPEDLIIVRTVVDLAQALGHRTVAEGVENEATAAILRSIGCQAAQGFLFAPPMPQTEFVTFLDSWAPGTADPVCQPIADAATR